MGVAPIHPHSHMTTTQGRRSAARAAGSRDWVGSRLVATAPAGPGPIRHHPWPSAEPWSRLRLRVPVEAVQPRRHVVREVRCTHTHRSPLAKERPALSSQPRQRHAHAHARTHARVQAHYHTRTHTQATHARPTLVHTHTNAASSPLHRPTRPGAGATQPRAGAGVRSGPRAISAKDAASRMRRKDLPPPENIYQLFINVYLHYVV